MAEVHLDLGSLDTPLLEVPVLQPRVVVAAAVWPHAVLGPLCVIHLAGDLVGGDHVVPHSHRHEDV